MLYVNLIKSYRDVVAVCDVALIGRKFEQDNFQLDVKESFYKGKEMTVEEAIETMIDMAKEDATFNIVGPTAVKSAIEAGVITEESVGKIHDIPFALVLV